jgi:hypothetical protein
MKQVGMAVLVAMTLLLSASVQTSAQSEGYDQFAFTNGEAYVFAAWVAFEGETASSLFDYLMEPATLDIIYGTDLKEDFDKVQRDGVVGGTGWQAGFRWDLEYHGVPGEQWVIPAEGKIYRIIVLDPNLGKAEDSYQIYFNFLRESVATGGFGTLPAGFAAVEEDPNCVGNGQLHPFCPYVDLIASWA